MKMLKLLALITAISTMALGQIFINEIDYDQPGTDSKEFIEIAGLSGIYSFVSIELVNGNDGSTYRVITIPSMTITDETGGYGFYVVGADSVLNVDNDPGSFTLQNGAPDGVVLKLDGTIVDAVAYEGSLIAGDGNPMEEAGEDISFADTVLSLSRTALDGSSWEHTTATPGEINTTQSFVPAPQFGQITLTPAVPNDTANVSVCIVISDPDGTINSAILTYTVNDGSGMEVPLGEVYCGENTWGGEIPAQAAGSHVEFIITATDNDARVSISRSYEYTVINSAGLTIADARLLGIGKDVTLSGLVNSVNYSSSGSEYTFEDSTAGIVLYLSGSVVDLNIGDHITVVGTTAEYGGKFEVVPSSSSDVTINSTNNGLPDPQIISVAELYSNGENYEGEFIKILQVSNRGTGDGWPSTGVNANLDISDNGTDVTVLRVDKETDIDGSPEPVWPVDVLGVVTEYNGTYQILPRMQSDFVSEALAIFNNALHSPGFVPSGQEITITIDILPEENVRLNSANIKYGINGPNLNPSNMWLNSGNSWMGIIPAQDAGVLIQYQVEASVYDSTSGTSSTVTSGIYQIAVASTIADIQSNPAVGKTVSVEGVVTIGSGLLRADRTSMYIQDNSGHGINLYHSSPDIDLQRGDLVQVTGVIETYFTTVEITNFSYQVISTGNPIPSPLVLSNAQANLAQWEGTLLQVWGEITDTWAAGGGQSVKITDGTDTTLVRIWGTTGVNVTPLTIGSTWAFVGVESQYYDEFQLLVAYDEDVMDATSVDPAETMTPVTFGLNPAYPNPFNPSTTVSWSLDKYGEYSVTVFDVMGREITQLATGTAEAGSYSMRWDASDLSSGVYFVQLTSTTGSSMQKVMLLK